MIVKTMSFGELEIEPQDIYHFTQGLPGFEEILDYIIVQPDPTLPFCYFQAVTASEIALLVCNPFLFFPEYDFQLSEIHQQELNINDDKNIAVWSVVTVDSNYDKATMNLLAPIIVNLKDKRGKQIILHDTDYLIKHTLTFTDSTEPAALEG